MKITINKGTSFLLTDLSGDIIPGEEFGLYHQDTRFLSTYRLTIDGVKPVLLAARQVKHYLALHHLTNPPIGDIPQGQLSITRRRFVGDGLHEDIDITNYSLETCTLTIRLEYGVDFADIFEVKTKGVDKSMVTRILPKDEVGDFAFDYSQEDFMRRIIFRFAQKPSSIKEGVVEFKIEIVPQEKWHTCIDYYTLTSKEVKPVKHTCKTEDVNLDTKDGELDKWRKGAPVLNSDYDVLDHAYKRSIKDLFALRLKGEGVAGADFLPAAGIPWYMTFFGRDSIITSYQTLLTFPKLANGTLRTLAKYQGEKVNDFNEEEPGKILHEVRFGELAAMGKIPHTPYYGSVDATLLWIILLFETYRWTNDRKLVEDLKENLLRALDWIDEYGDKDGDGYVEYIRRNKRGLENQGWKDSNDSIQFEDGSLAEPPITLCEVQGYVYDAKIKSAELLKILGEEKRAEELIREAKGLQKRFLKDFWMEDKNYFAEALDKDKNQVDSITSNPGHLLWSRIIEEEHAKQIVETLMSDEMFSGWGVRTLSSSNRGYNPTSYHNGSVWPHDNSLIAIGMINYGFFEEAIRIIEGIILASDYYPGHRLPELFCGFSKKESPYPVEYLSSSSPQAWCAGAISLFIQAMLGLYIDSIKKKVKLRPLLPKSVKHLKVQNIQVGEEKLSFNVREEDGKTSVEFTKQPHGFEIDKGEGE